jgi:hypothetical protein
VQTRIRGSAEQDSEYRQALSASVKIQLSEILGTPTMRMLAEAKADMATHLLPAAAITRQEHPPGTMSTRGSVIPVGSGASRRWVQTLTQRHGIKDAYTRIAWQDLEKKRLSMSD